MATPVGDLEDLYNDYAELFAQAEGEFQCSVLNITVKLLERMTKELHEHCEKQLAIVSIRMQSIRSQKDKTRIVEIPVAARPDAGVADHLKFEPVLNRPDPAIEGFLAQQPGDSVFMEVGRPVKNNGWNAPVYGQVPIPDNFHEWPYPAERKDG